MACGWPATWLSAFEQPGAHRSGAPAFSRILYGECRGRGPASRGQRPPIGGGGPLEAAGGGGQAWVRSATKGCYQDLGTPEDLRGQAEAPPRSLSSRVLFAVRSGRAVLQRAFPRRRPRARTSLILPPPGLRADPPSRAESSGPSDTRFTMGKPSPRGTLAGSRRSRRSAASPRNASALEMRGTGSPAARGGCAALRELASWP
jgi:hypothetical protein